MLLVMLRIFNPFRIKCFEIYQHVYIDVLACISNIVLWIYQPGQVFKCESRSPLSKSSFLDQKLIKLLLWYLFSLIFQTNQEILLPWWKLINYLVDANDVCTMFCFMFISRDWEKLYSASSVVTQFVFRS